MSIIRVAIVVIFALLPLAAGADWSEVSSDQLVRAANQSIIRHEWTGAATDSTPYDISACSGRVEARFDPSTGDASTDASAQIRACRTSTDTAQRCRSVMTFEGAHDGSTWYPLNAITPGETYIMADATAATTGGDTARAEVRCTAGESLQVSSSGGRIDGDKNGLYEIAHFWDADGDGSGAVTCTAKDTPDPLCKVVGEVVYPDAGDDINCAIHGCGFGQMEKTGTLYLPTGVLGLYHCWNASSPSTNDRATFYGGSSALHDSAADPSFSDCPVDSEGSVLTSISLQDWQGTLVGSGSDSRKLETATMSATRRRDRGSYLVNDMGPWHQNACNTSAADRNNWFGACEHRRGLSFGFHTLVPAPNQHTGSGAADGDSKGWGSLLLDADLEIFQSNVLCIQNSGGTPGSTHSANGWMSALVAGDTLLVPSKSDANSGAVSTVPVRIKSVTATACGAGNVGLRVELGGSQFATGAQDRTHPYYAAAFGSAGFKVIHPRSDFFETRAVVRNLTLAPQDPWNEAGGDCAGSGVFSLTGDDAQADFDCDTQNLVGFWGGGDYSLEDVVINNWHFFAIDGGSAGARPTARRVTFIHGQGGPIADTGIGWRFHETLVDNTGFNAANNVFSLFGAEVEVEDFEIRNSSYFALATFNSTHQFQRWSNIRSLSNTFSTNFNIVCGAKWLTFRDIFTSGRGAGTLGGGGYGGSVMFDCDEPANPIEQVLVENVITEPPDDGIGAEQGPLIMFKADDATGTGPNLTPWGGITGNIIRGARAIGYGGATGGESGCLFGAIEMDSDNPADDDGESIVFTTNTFSDASIQSDGRAFCIARTSGGGHSAIDSVTASPTWGDPQACNVMEGGTIVPYARCGSRFRRGSLSIDPASLTTGTCDTPVSVTATGTIATDRVVFSLRGDVTGLTGWGPLDSMRLDARSAADAIEFEVCNPTGGTVNAAAVTVDWEIRR